MLTIQSIAKLGTKDASTSAGRFGIRSNKFPLVNDSDKGVINLGKLELDVWGGLAAHQIDIESTYVIIRSIRMSK